MATRLNSLLTPDGARAWYAHDVAELLQEVTVLRQELAEAREALAADGVADTGEPLPQMLADWKATATGVYEKATVKKLRTEIQAKQQEIDQLEERLQAANTDATVALDTLDRERAERSEERQRLEDAVADAVAQKERYATQAGEYQAQARDAISDLDKAAREHTADLLASQFETEELKKKAREALQAIIEHTLG